MTFINIGIDEVADPRLRKQRKRSMRKAQQYVAQTGSLEVVTEQEKESRP
ncbi:hypothetical protein KDK_75410 [Dictyobacter kobayashii]|uniref:Uncharacterized protein n=1 Tax=Dictyobacter kobayashii TaxID=2014872 RepID=A0A402AX89_9CHLR|nr:hypothetical protein KDK_75410 [Dictyobacter kobayashii]